MDMPAYGVKDASHAGRGAQSDANRRAFHAAQFTQKIQEELLGRIKNSGTAFLEDGNAVSKIVSAGSLAVPLILRGLNCRENSNGFMDAAIASKELGIMVARADPQAISLFAEALKEKAAPLGMLCEILENFPRKPVIDCFVSLMNEGIALRNLAEEALISLIGAGEEKGASLDLQVRNAKAAISYTLNLRSRTDLINALGTFRMLNAELLEAGKKTDEEILVEMASIADMEARGTACLKHSMLALSKIGSIKEALGMVPLLKHKSKEVRECTVYSLLRYSYNHKSQRALNLLCCRLLTAISESRSGRFETTMRVLQKGPFENSLRHIYFKDNGLASFGIFNRNQHIQLLGILFASFPDIRKNVYESFAGDDAASIGNALDVCKNGLGRMEIGGIEKNELSLITSRINSISKGHDLKNQKTANEVLALAHGLAGENGSTNSALHKQAPQCVLIAIEKKDVRLKLLNILRGVGASSLSVRIAENITDAMNVVMDERHLLSCCIVSKDFGNHGGQGWKGLVNQLNESGFYPGLVLLNDAPDKKFRQELLEIGLENGNKPSDFRRLKINFVLSDANEVLIESRVMTMLEGFGALEPKAAPTRKGGVIPTEDYLGHSLTRKALALVFGEGWNNLKPARLNHGYVFTKNTPAGRRHIFLVDPAAQITDISSSGAKGIGVVDYGTINPEVEGAVGVNHNLRVCSRELGGLKRRSGMLSPDGSPAHIQIGKGGRYSLSNRTSQGAALVFVEEHH